MASRVTRREWLSNLFRPLRTPAEREGSGARNGGRLMEPQVAVIQGRYCLAYQGTFCSTCWEHCPESDAIDVEDGIPRVVPDRCTGCGVCQDVCPAPTNAVLTVPKKRFKSSAP